MSKESKPKRKKDEEEDEEETSKKKKKGGNPSGMDFIDFEAGEDSEEEEEEEDDVEPDFQKPDPSKQPTSLKPLPSKRETGQQFFKKLEEKYSQAQEGEDDIEDEEEMELEKNFGKTKGIQQQQQYPTVKDPKLFMVKARPQKEREAAFNLLQKCFNLEAQGKPLNIMSAIVLEANKGFIYVEAFKEVHVKDAVHGVEFLSENKIKLVPIKEMTGILSYQKKGTFLKVDDWVRVKRGIYKGDLAQVVEVDEPRAIAKIKLIPRLEIDGKRVKKLHHQTDSDPSEEKKGSQGKKFQDGYLLKYQKFQSLEIKNVHPTIDEITQFTSSIDENIPSNLGSRKKETFKRGDEVVVTEDDMKGMVGTVYEVKDDTITILPRHKDIKDPLLISASSLKKLFETGDYVKVVSGKNEGSSGPIVKIDNDTVIIYSEMLGEEIEVFSRDIRKMSETSSTTTVVSGDYALHDLVRIDGTTAGVIIRMEKDAFKVLDNNGIIQTVTVQEMGKKITTRASFYKTPDKNGTFVGVGETIRVLEGSYNRTEGLIKHVFRGFLFCHSREIIENSGIFVVRGKSTELIRENKSNPTIQEKGIRRDAKSGLNMKNKKYKHPDTGKLVKITAGIYKGYQGILKEANDTHAQILLQSKFKLITVRMEPREFDIVQIEKEKTRPSFSQVSYPRTPSRDSATTPNPYFDGSRTPNPYEFPETPSRTPGGNDSSNPFNPKQPNTPRWTYDDTKTPTTPSIRTPFSPFPVKNPTTPGSILTPITPGNSYTPTTYSSVQTPGSGSSYSSVQTPGSGSSYSSVQTPGSSYSSVQTPGTSYSSVQTPGTSYSSVQTPGSSYSSIQTPNTSYSSIQTPGTSYSSFQTPGTFTPNTTNLGYSSLNYSSVLTPGSNLKSGEGLPKTPGSFSTLSPQISKKEEYEVQQEELYEKGVEVEVTEGQYSGMKGAIQKVQGSKASVLLVQNDEEKLVDVSTTFVRPTIPKKGDNIKVIKGKYKGKDGVVTSLLLEEGDVVFKHQGNFLYAKVFEIVKILK